MLDETLGTILQQWGQETFKIASSEEANHIAVVIFYFGNLIAQFPLANKANNMDWPQQHLLKRNGALLWAYRGGDPEHLNS